jgi:hypothetical protein
MVVVRIGHRMSEEVSQEAVEVSADGITVRKSFETDDFAVPTITFRIRSRRDDPVSLRLSEPIPESFSMDSVGFHPEYESDNWTAYEDHTVEFERSLAPEEELITVYGIRIDDPSDAAAFMTAPEITAVTPAGDDTGGDRTEVDESKIDDIAPQEIMSLTA